MSQPMEVPNPGSALKDPQCKVAFIYYVSTFRGGGSKVCPKMSEHYPKISKKVEIFALLVDMSKNVQNGPKMSKAVHKYPYTYVHKCQELSKNVQNGPKQTKNVQNVHKCPKKCFKQFPDND